MFARGWQERKALTLKYVWIERVQRPRNLSAKERGVVSSLNEWFCLLLFPCDFEFVVAKGKPGRNEIATKGDWQLNLPPSGWLTCQECAKIKSDDHPFLTSFFTAESNFRIYSICKSKVEKLSYEHRLNKLLSWISFISLVSSVTVFREVTQRSPFRGSVAWHPERRLLWKL